MNRGMDNIEWLQKAKTNPLFKHPEMAKVLEELMIGIQKANERANGAEAEVEYLREQATT